MANIQHDLYGKLSIPDDAATSSLSYTKFATSDGNRGRVGWIGVSYAKLAPVHVAAMLTALKVSAGNAGDSTIGVHTVTVEFDAVVRPVNELLRMIRQCESKSQQFRFTFLEPPSQLFGGRFCGEVFSNCNLVQVSGKHKWVITAGEIAAIGQK